jgi:N-dimethylarginine dimethylaminohydrolase
MKYPNVTRVLMCNPMHFIVEHTYNPWMKPGSVNTEKAKKQWHDLKNIYESLAIQVDIIEQVKGLHDMVFATDQGIVQGREVLLSNFRIPQRQGERAHYKKWFKENEYEIHELPNHHFLEGNGETYFWNDLIFVGTGYRSDSKIQQFLQKKYDREVVYLKIMDPAFYHLDVGFFPLNNETVFYYPQAYSPGTIKELKKRIPNLIEFSKEEAHGFCANSVVTDHHVVMQKNNPTFQKKLHSLGYKTVEVDLSEFIKSGGGAHCLTNILKIN